MSIFQIIRQRKWFNWCNEEVYYDNDEYISRKELLLDLAKHALIPFLQKNGYTISCTAHRVAECIARYLYFGKVMHEPYNNDWRKEDYLHYYYLLDDDDWEAFWSRRRLWEDLENVKTREMIRYIMWTLLDLYKSDATQDVDMMLGLIEDEHLPIDTRDPYLIDSSNGYFN